MKIAITVWGNRVSPVLEAARTLLVVHCQGGKIVNQRVFAMDHSHASLQRILQEQEVDVLLCGALCRMMRARLEGLGLELIPFITGEVEPLLARVLGGDQLGEFAMPGCTCGGCCQRTAMGRGRGDKGLVNRMQSGPLTKKENGR